MWAVLHHKIQPLLSFDNIIELNDVGMSDNFENVNLSGHSFDITNVSYPLLLQYFDGHLLLGIQMDSLLDLSKRPLTKCLHEFIVTYLVIFLCDYHI
jgi:hypothetical protein